MENYKNYYGFTKDPFAQNIDIKNLYGLPGLQGVEKRFLYAVDISAGCVITGEVGTGKSTSLRHASSKLHPSGYRIIPVLANTGTILEILRQIGLALDVECRSMSITTATKIVKTVLSDIVNQKLKPVLVIDEAHLMRVDVFAQLHLITQYEFDSKPAVSLILCGENSLLDKMMYHTSRPLASRIVARSHLEGLNVSQMEEYINHHIQVAGVKDNLYSKESILAIQQGSGGLLRRANTLARGGLIAASSEKCQTVTGEHIRIAATEII